MTVIERARRSDTVPNKRLRAAVEASGLPYAEIAERVGWSRREGARLQRVLGINPCYWRSSDGTIARTIQRAVTPRVAERICQAIHVDPMDLGL